MVKLQKDERIAHMVRKHWFVFAIDIVSIGLLMLIPLFTIGLLFVLAAYGYLTGSLVTISIFAISVLLLFLWIAGFILWTDYYLDILIITNKHIIDIEQKGLFSRELSVFRLDKVQDVTSEINGIIPTLLKFGTIHVQTAGEDREFLIHGIPKPFEVRHIISKEQEKALTGRIFSLSDESLDRLHNNTKDT